MENASENYDKDILCLDTILERSKFNQRKNQVYGLIHYQVILVSVN